MRGGGVPGGPGLGGGSWRRGGGEGTPGVPGLSSQKRVRGSNEGGNPGVPRLGGAPGMGLGAAGQAQSRGSRVLIGAGQVYIYPHGHTLCPGGTELIVLFC